MPKNKKCIYCHEELDKDDWKLGFHRTCYINNKLKNKEDDPYYGITPITI